MIFEAENAEKNSVPAGDAPEKRAIDLSFAESGGLAPYKDGRIWTDVFLKALEEYSEIFIPAGKYYIDRSLVVRSGTRIYADRHAEIIRMKGVKTLLLRNESVIDGSDSRIADDAPCDRDISVCGGIWGEENDGRTEYGLSGCYDDDNSMNGVCACFLFSGVRGLTLKNLVFRSTGGFACQLGRIDGLSVENLRFESCYADGLHINGNVKNGTVKNLYGHTEDDLIALNAYDWDNSSINFGSIENLTVDGVMSDREENSHKSFRILPGVYRYRNGEKEDCCIRNLVIRNVSGITAFKMYLQTPAYAGHPERDIGVGRIENAVFENIETDTSSPVDMQPNYVSGDPVTGCFAAFEIGSDVKNLRFENVRVRLDREKYPNSYFMLAGPKSQYYPDRGLELFDPYVSCTVEGVVYRNVFINGCPVNDLSGYIKTVEFDSLYPSELPFGKGKIISVSKDEG